MKLSISEYAKLQSISTTRVYQLEKAGNIKTVKDHGKKYVIVPDGTDNRSAGNDASEIIEAQKTELEELKAKLTELQTENGRIKGDYEARMKQLEEDHAGELEKLKTGHAAELEQKQEQIERHLQRISELEHYNAFYEGELQAKNHQLEEASNNIRLLSAPKGLFPALRSLFHREPEKNRQNS